MKKYIASICFLIAFISGANAQDLTIKSNAVGWATYGTINIGSEIALWPKWTFDIAWGTNPWKWKNHKQTLSWSAKGEIRHWIGARKGKFNGSFIGVHGGYAHYNWGVNKYRYDGWLTMAGMSYGYTLPICDRWYVEANLGVGWLHYEYDQSGRYHYPGDITIYGSSVKNEFGITSAGLSVIFAIQ